MSDIRTDMAKEAVELHDGRKIEGVVVNEFSYNDDITVNTVNVMNTAGEKNIGKSIGKYVTIECQKLFLGEKETQDELCNCVAQEIKKMIIPIMPEDNVLVIGLGNRKVTADSLGPLVCESVFVSRHIKKYLPELIDERTTGVCSFSTGVLGETGIESFDIVEGITKKIKPKLIIAIDALAAGSLSRLGTSVQISDAGIAPGSGIGNKRNAINSFTLGIPVIAIGVPTVVYASTIFFELVENSVLSDKTAKNTLMRIIDTVENIEGGDMVVTPKEIDILVNKTSKILGDSLNIALHGHLSKDEIEYYMN